MKTLVEAAAKLIARLYPEEGSGGPRKAEPFPRAWTALYPGYGEYLRSFGGWEPFYDDIVLFGPGEIPVDDPEARKVIRSQKKLWTKLKVSPEEVIPGGRGEVSGDWILICPGRSGCEVVWISDLGSERFETFSEFLISVTEYLQYEIEEVSHE